MLTYIHSIQSNLFFFKSILLFRFSANSSPLSTPQNSLLTIWHFFCLLFFSFLFLHLIILTNTIFLPFKMLFSSLFTSPYYHILKFHLHYIIILNDRHMNLLSQHYPFEITRYEIRSEFLYCEQETTLPILHIIFLS